MFAAGRRVVGLWALLLAEGIAMLALIRLGRRPAFALPWHRLAAWLETAPPGDVLVASLRWVALVGVGWVAATTLLYALAVAARVPTATRALRWSAAPIVRRAVEAAFAASVASVAVVTPAGASARSVDPIAVTTNVRDGRAPHVTETPAPPATDAPDAPDAVDVAPGDNLWELAARVVATATGRPRDELSAADVAAYWGRLCDANAPHLSSGDVDVVYPGERIELPPYA